MLVEETGIERELLCNVREQEARLRIVTEYDYQHTLIRSLHVSLLLLALPFPAQGESLYGFMEQWIEQAPIVPVILLCTTSQDAFCKKGIQLGVQGLLSKAEKVGISFHSCEAGFS